MRFLALEGLPFRGYDEKPNSSNHGNFLEFLDVQIMYNDELKREIAKLREISSIHVIYSKANTSYFFNEYLICTERVQ